MAIAASRGVLYPLLTGVTTGSSIGLLLPVNIQNHTILVNCSAGIGAGTIGFETAVDPDYTGTWASISTVTAVASNIRRIVAGPSCYAVIRARITVDITGGTVDVYYIGN